MIIKADLHVHSHNSFDCRMSLAEIARAAKEKGVDCVCVCDHNTTDGYYEVLRETDENGFLDGVLFLPAIEYSTDAGHIVGMFMDSPVPLNKKSDALIKDLNRMYFPVLAHPFAMKGHDELIKKYIDLGVAVEAGNGRIKPKHNRAAVQAVIGNFTAGSDAHLPAEIGNTYVELDVKELTPDGVRDALVHGRGNIVCKPSKRVFRGISQLYKQIDAGHYYRVPDRLIKTAALFIADLFTSRKTVVTEGKQWQ